MTSELAAVIGYPVSRSLSPAIFRFLSRRLGHPLTYGKLEVRPSEFLKFFKLAEKGAFLGWNVTIPYKERAFARVGRLSKEARAIGAVNVVRFGRRFSEGFNTDAIGIAEALRAARFGLGGRSVQVLGAGGVARAAVFAAARGGAREIWVWNRTPSRARRLAREFSRLFARTEVRAGFAPTECDLYFQATSGELDLPSRATPKSCAFEVIYRPRETRFLRQAKKNRLKTVEGLDLLIWQAIGTWEIWIGKIPSAKKRRLQADLKRYLIKEIEK